jgi:uncharacterized membrane protein HdeD (DUF308 family)
MYIRFMLLGLLDIVGGTILLFELSMLVKLIAIALITKGILSFVRATQH